MLIYLVSSLLPSLIRPIRKIRGKTKQPLRLCPLASKTNRADSLRQFATPLSNPLQNQTTFAPQRLGEKNPIADLLRQLATLVYNLSQLGESFPTHLS